MVLIDIRGEHGESIATVRESEFIGSIQKAPGSVTEKHHIIESLELPPTSVSRQAGF